MRKSLILIFLVSVMACNSSKKATSKASEKFTVESLENMNARDLKSQYPDANIKEGSGLFEEGTEERAYSILYPETSDELHITWKDAARTEILDIRFAEEGKWKSKSGIKVGTSYEELNKINEKTISFYGFGWDYSGAVLWNNGELENSGLRVFLSPEQAPENKFIGDQIIEPSPEEIKMLNLRVSSIIINYAN